VLDRYSQHTKNCRACRTALAGVERGISAVTGMGMLATAAAVAMLVTCGPGLNGAAVAGALVAAILCAGVVAGLQKLRYGTSRPKCGWLWLKACRIRMRFDLWPTHLAWWFHKAPEPLGERKRRSARVGDSGLRRVRPRKGIVCCRGASSCYRLRTFLSKNSLSIQSTSRLENPLSTKREFVTSNDKPRIVAYRYIIEASTDVS
jgi:hypothetical protein